jgi:hypothetical protein
MVLMTAFMLFTSVGVNANDSYVQSDNLTLTDGTPQPPSGVYHLTYYSSCGTTAASTYVCLACSDFEFFMAMSNLASQAEIDCASIPI